MSAERTLHFVNNAPPYETAYVAAVLLEGSRQGAVPRGQVADLIQTAFDNATPGRRIAELAIELIDQRDLPAERLEQAVQLDPREGVIAPGGPSNGAGQAASGTAKPPKGTSLGMG